ncbi:MAG: transporter substrate-binding protein [Rhodocyclaceae bacterium]|nr:transporter substrate-binding protein [Rhodocyclaceae bacterium]
MKTTGRRTWTWIGLLAVLLALGAFFAAGRLRPAPAPPPAPRESLTLGTPQTIFGLPLAVAEEQGLFREEGLDVTVKRFPTGKSTLEAMLRGEVEVGAGGETPIVLASFKRRDFVIIASISHSDNGGQLVAHPYSGIRTAADLPGHRIGVLWGTTAHYFLDVLLADQGLKPSAVTEVPLEAPRMAATLAARQVDAIAAFEPYASQAIAALRGSATVLDCRERCRETVVLIVSRDFPRRRPIAAQRLLRATGRAIDWIHQYPREAMALAARRLNMDIAVFDGRWNDYEFVLGLDQAYLLSLENQARWALRTFPEAGAAVPNYLDFFDFGPLTAVAPGAVAIPH